MWVLGAGRGGVGVGNRYKIEPRKLETAPPPPRTRPQNPPQYNNNNNINNMLSNTPRSLHQDGPRPGLQKKTDHCGFSWPGWSHTNLFATRLGRSPANASRQVSGGWVRRSRTWCEPSGVLLIAFINVTNVPNLPPAHTRPLLFVSRIDSRINLRG